ncbi:hypothetical protein RND71_002336 [Anisodus tanguticus]|uniref:Pentatricopeptide repeat-containing protein n=1 Tax=Anisodus tanguticus TaxID=243964 RepID=A0AAE1T0X6_9SOLA|nr:hypothetical protein RND71_002336 [Anisodus tanguticus]
MVLEYGFTPKIEHYGCLIDILGRAGLLETARELIKGLPSEGDATAWRACRVHGSVELGEQRDMLEVKEGKLEKELKSSLSGKKEAGRSAVEIFEPS